MLSYVDRFMSSMFQRPIGNFTTRPPKASPWLMLLFGYCNQSDQSKWGLFNELKKDFFDKNKLTYTAATAKAFREGARRH